MGCWRIVFAGAALLAGLSVPAEAARHVVVIQNMAFGKAPAALQVGDTIVWRNEDILEHTATARSGAFDIDMPPGKDGEVTLKQAGRLEIFCRYHPTMTMKLVVASPHKESMP